MNQKRLFVTCSLVLGFFLVVASFAEARPGGGRSFGGFRGSRGFGGGSSSFRSQPAPPPAQPGNYGQPGGYGQTSSGGTLGSGSFGRGLMGGLAGGMIGSMLLGRMGHAGEGGAGGGFGLLEILLLFGVGYAALRAYSSRKLSASSGFGQSTQYSGLSNVGSLPFGGSRVSGEQELAAQLSRSDAGFDLAKFKEERMDDFVRLQAAWNLRDLSSLSDVIGPELRAQLDADIRQLKADRQINRIENIAVRNTELVEVWDEAGQEFATLRFRASLLDYTLDEVTGQVVSGDRLQPVKFEENWTFIRRAGRADALNSWKLSAIEA